MANGRGDRRKGTVFSSDHSSLEKSMGTGLRQYLVCRIGLIDTLYGSTELVQENADNDDVLCVVMEGYEESEYEIFQIAIPDGILQENRPSLLHGELYVSVENVLIETSRNGRLRLTALETTRWKVLDASPFAEVRREHRRRRRRAQSLINDDDKEIRSSTPVDDSANVDEEYQSVSPAVGTHSVFFVHVSTLDSIPATAPNQFLYGIVGESTYSMKTQYKACSFGQIDFELAPLGMIEVHLPQNISDFSDRYELTTVAQEAARQKTGTDNLQDMADHVFFCLPPGTGEWAGYTSMFHWRIVLNSDWCKSLSASIHEVGHNLGLHHSNNHRASMDHSGYMSEAFPHARWPRKCFNSHKHWKLGWFQSNSLALLPWQEGSTDIFSMGEARGQDDEFLASNADSNVHTHVLIHPILVQVATFVDYNLLTSSENHLASTNDAFSEEFSYVLVNIGDIYFLQYNRAKGINIETGQDPNRLTIVQAQDDGSSEFITALDIDESVNTVLPYEGKNDLLLEVCDQLNYDVEARKPDMIVLSIGFTHQESRCNNYTSQIPRISPEVQHQSANGLPKSSAILLLTAFTIAALILLAIIIRNTRRGLKAMFKGDQTLPS